MRPATIALGSLQRRKQRLVLRQQELEGCAQLYGPEHNDYDAPCEITVLGVDTNPTFEHAPAPYRVQKRVLVDYIYG